MGRRLGASRKMPNLGDYERLENKEWLLETEPKKVDAAHDPWSNENVTRNRERYIKSPLKFIEEHNRKKFKSYA